MDKRWVGLRNMLMAPKKRPMRRISAGGTLVAENQRLRQEVQGLKRQLGGTLEAQTRLD